MLEEIKLKFVALFNAEPICFRSPGRINIIGEHTDYNNGFVLPAAINKSIYFAIAPNSFQKFRFFAYDLNEYIEITDVALSKIQWANYLLGVIDGLYRKHKSPGYFDLVFGGDLPFGAGFSSSAAIEVGLAFALNKVYDLENSAMDLTLIAQKAEHDFVGVKCGIMDQFAVMHGKADKLIKLDCRSLEYEYHDFKLKDYSFVFADTGVKHNLAENEYNLRREQCEKGVEIMKENGFPILSLRDLSLAELEENKTQMKDLIFRRCSYVIEENERLQNALRAMEKNDWKSFGEQLYGSHEGLRHKYEVSCRELDILVEATYDMPFVLGARMMGGGFGGCTINLVQNEAIPEFKTQLQKAYVAHFEKPLKIYEMKLSDGVGMC
jgi:galactokinase